MGLGIHWFKEYEIKSYGESFNLDPEPFGYFKYDDYYIVFLDGNSTSHSYYNVEMLQMLFEEQCGKQIPRLPYEPSIESKEYRLDLIEPKEMIIMCDTILSTSKIDEIGMRHRVEWFKSLAESGYYIAYDFE